MGIGTSRRLIACSHSPWLATPPQPPLDIRYQVTYLSRSDANADDTEGLDSTALCRLLL